LLRDHCRSKGRTDEAQAWEKRLQEWQQRNQVLRAERYRLRPTDKFEPHDLPMTLLADLTRQLHAVPGVRQCYLVRKQVERQPNKPLLILAFSCNGWWPARSRKRADAIRKRIIAALQFPGELLVLNLEECGWRLRMRIRRVVGSQI